MRGKGLTSWVDWLSELKVTLKGIHSIEERSELSKILRKHSRVFTNELGCLQGTKVNLHTDSQVSPIFFKAHSVPLALKDKVEELERIQRAGIIFPVQFSKWAAPIVLVMKTLQMHGFPIQTYYGKTSKGRNFNSKVLIKIFPRSYFCVRSMPM